MSKLFESTCWQVHRKAADMEKSHFHPVVEQENIALELWQYSNAPLLFSAQPRVARVRSGPKSSNYKRSGMVPECGLALIVLTSVSACILAFVVLHGSHLSSKVLLCGCCSVTCVSVPAGWLERHTSNHGDVMEENTLHL